MNDNNIVTLHQQKPFKPRKISAPDQMGQHCAKYLERLAAMNKSANTIASYQTDLEQFVGFMQSRSVHYVAGVSSRDMDDFVLHCLQVRRVSPRTACRKIGCLKSFFKWARQEDLIVINPATKVESPKYHKTHVIAPEMDELIEFLNRIPANTPMGIRDRAFYELMLYSAGRISGLIGLNLYDPNAAVNTISLVGRMVYTIKGGGTKEKMLSPPTLSWVSRWLDVRSDMANRDEVALFVSAQGGRASRNTMYARLKKYGREFDLPSITPHMFRHRRVGQVLENLGVQVAQGYADHKNPNTTIDVYGHSSPVKVRELVDGLCPLPGRG